MLFDIEAADEYGGGGPEYVVDGLLMVMWDMFGPGIVVCRVWSILSKRYFSKSKLFIDGKASLQTICQ